MLFCILCFSCFRVCSLRTCVTCWERADLLALVGDVYCIFVTFPCGILGQVLYLIVSFPDLCRLFYFIKKLGKERHCLITKRMMVEWLFLAIPWGGLRFVIMVFPGHTHYISYNKTSGASFLVNIRINPPSKVMFSV